MKFRDVKVGEAFDFPMFDGCIKISARKYKFEAAGQYYEVEVGTTNVTVENIRAAYPWELELAGINTRTEHA